MDNALDGIFSRYQVSAGVGERKANTPTLSYKGKREGIRRIEESIVELFHSLNRSGYPSAYVYNTGQWQKYQDLLLACFQLSESARLLLCERLIAFGLVNLPKNSFYARETVRIRLFEEVVKDYERGVQGENGGLVFQAIAYGYIAADRPHLSIIADKVRTGSARQKRFGDIDCYCGLDLGTSIEVKDRLYMRFKGPVELRAETAVTLCLVLGSCGRTQRSSGIRAAFPARCPGADATRSEAATRSPR